jgi:hypothetical protein
MIGWVLFLGHLVVDVLVIWYIKQLLTKFVYFSQKSDDMLTAVRHYQEHLEEVYGLETYYGDNTLAGLLQHTSDVLEDLKELEDIFITEETGGDVIENETEDQQK